MASPMGISIGFLVLVLFLSHGSARKMASEDMVKESNDLTRQLFEEPEPPEVEPLSSDNEPKSGAPMDDEVTVLDGTQVEYGHPVGLPAPYWRLGPLSPLPVLSGCGPAPTIQPMPGCQPTYYPQPQPNYPPQPLYPPQPAYPPQPEPGCNQPECQPQPNYPPEPTFLSGGKPTTYPPCNHPSCQQQPQPNYPPQYVPAYPYQPGQPPYEPQPDPGCNHPECQPENMPLFPTEPKPECNHPACQAQPEPTYGPEPECNQFSCEAHVEPFYPPWPQYPPQGTESPPLNVNGKKKEDGEYEVHISDSPVEAH